jgi:uncharacterized membrane protein
MTLPHLLNLCIHIGTGVLAISIGAAILLRRKGDERHRRAGRWFGWLTSVVVFSAALGLIAFRFLPLFAVLSVLVGYQLLSGWRVAHTQEQGPARRDLAATIVTILLTIPLTRLALEQAPQSRAVILSSVGALAVVLTYDLARAAFRPAWHRVAWPLEHIYKLNGALFGMISAFVGNTVRAWHPWSQLLPSVIGLLVIAALFWRQLTAPVTRRTQTLP